MGKKIIIVIMVILMVLPVYTIVTAFGKNGNNESMVQAQSFYRESILAGEPCTKPDGSKYSIAYVDIDPYPASGEMLYYFIEELRNTGWISLSGHVPFNSKNLDACKLIDYLADLDLGDYIEFRHDANYYIAVDDYEECLASLREHAEKKDIDLIFCMGTSPGEMVIHELGITDIPVMVYFSVDPVSAGLSKEEEYSGQENVWCHTSSDIYLNQLRFYYDNCNFNNIGMVYYSESVGAMNQYRIAAEQIGCRISERKIDTLSGASEEVKNEYYHMLEETFRDLIENDGIDAFMLGTDIIKDTTRIGQLLQVFYDKGIPVFVQNGEYYVEYGAMLAVTASDAESQAPFAVNAMSRIFHGEKPGNVYQKFIISPYISVNLDTAKKIRKEVSQDLLISAEKIIATGK